MRTLIIAVSLLTSIYQMNAQDTEDKIKKVITDFITSTDEQNAEKLAATMNDKAMQYVIFGPNLLTFTKQEYVDQLKAKKVGGQPRTIDFEETLLSGETVATVRLTASSAVIRFHYQITLLNHQGNWQIVSISTKAERI
ncbi:MAG: nuclear transport factor 2 family protein [Roseivirga sp.]|nr:nuclear transport factor 2 family protein [Roseivirga sp.]